MDKKIVAKSHNIKGVNHKRILQLIVKGTGITRLDLAYKLKISIPTVTSNINELIEAGVAEEADAENSAIGRRPKVIKLKPNSRVSIGISITRDKVVIMVMNLLNEILLKHETKYGADDLLQYIQQAKDIANEFLHQLNIEEEKILGVGISIPGTINRTLGVAEYINMGCKEIKLSEIEDLFDCEVHIENEANLSLLAEKTIGGYKELNNLLYIGINEGLGGGIFVNGELFTGQNGRAGEFGHMHVNSEIDSASNSIEDYISTLGLIQRYNKRTCVPIKSFSEFEELVQEKDYVACEILSEGIGELMVMIYNLTIIFDAQKIIIGGKVGRLIKEEDINTFYDINKYKNFMYNLNVEIIFSNIKGTTTIGAALLPIIDFYKITYNH